MIVGPKFGKTGNGLKTTTLFHKILSTKLPSIYMSKQKMIAGPKF